MNKEIIKAAEGKALYSGLMLARGLHRRNVPPPEVLRIMRERKMLHWERALKAATREAGIAKLVAQVEAATCPHCGAHLTYSNTLARGCGFCGFCRINVKVV